MRYTAFVIRNAALAMKKQTPGIISPFNGITKYSFKGT
jgi:hypothetical protein